MRKSVELAIKGKKVTRKKAEFKYLKNGNVENLHIMITASYLNIDGRDLVLLILEDITEMVKLRQIIPICANCKKIRDDNQFWNEVEVYIQSVADVDFTHGICPDCMKKLYPEFCK